MASTYSTNLAIELIGTGDQAGSWGNTTNTNLGTLIEQAISGYVTQAVATGTDTTITIPNGSTGVARNMYIELTGTGGTNTNLIVPANKKLYFIFNNSTGAVTVKVSGQTGVSVPQGKKVVLTSNGTDVVNGLNYIADFGSNSATITQLTATSATITNLTLTSLVISNLSIDSANITTLTGTTFGTTATTQLRGASADITTLTGSSMNVTTATHASANITTIAGTTATYTSATVTNLALTSLTLSNLSIASANVTTLTATNETISGNLTLSGGTANGVLYLNGSKVATSGSALTYNGTEIGTTSIGLNINNANALIRYQNGSGTRTGYLQVRADAFDIWSDQAAVPMVFGVANAEAMRLTSTGLGIGTSSPAEKLTVQKGNGGIRLDGAGTASSSVWLDYYVPNNGGVSTASNFAGRIYAVSSGVTDFSDNSIRIAVPVGGSSTPVDTLTVKAGNLGLGVTPSAWNTDYRALQIKGGVSLSNDGGNTDLRLSQNVFVNSSAQNIYIATAAATRYRQNAGVHYWDTAASGTAGTAISFTTAMTLTAAGELVVGTTAAAGSSQVTAYGATNGQIAVQNSTNWSRLLQNSGDLYIDNGVGGSAGNIIFRNSSSTTERARITSGGNLLVGTTTASYDTAKVGSTHKFLNVQAGASLYAVNTLAGNQSAAGNRLGLLAFVNDTNSATYKYSAWILSETEGSTANQLGGRIVFSTTGDASSAGPIERARITSGGDLLVATTSTYSAYAKLHVLNGLVTATNGTDGGVYFGATTGGTELAYLSMGRSYNLASTGEIALATSGAKAILFGTNNTERARITSGGVFLVGKTASTLTTAGCELNPVGLAALTRSADAALVINRLTDDGTLVEFQQDNVAEGSISVSGNTVSYNAFAGSHWSQMQDGSKPDILRGTVMESINELCEWPGEANERLPKAKISDTAGSKKVYGVFMAWDNDWTETNDMYVTAVGAFICRVNGSVTVEEGDLLESNGDGTARVQADDIIRSSTIGKVTSTVKTHEYDDGSYCVPTVLYCG